MCEISQSGRSVADGVEAVRSRITRLTIGPVSGVLPMMSRARIVSARARIPKAKIRSRPSVVVARSFRQPLDRIFRKRRAQALQINKAALRRNGDGMGPIGGTELRE